MPSSPCAGHRESFWKDESGPVTPPEINLPSLTLSSSSPSGTHKAVSVWSILLASSSLLLSCEPPTAQSQLLTYLWLLPGGGGPLTLWLWLPAPIVFWGTKNPEPTQDTVKAPLLCLLLKERPKEQIMVILTHKEKPSCSPFIPSIFPENNLPQGQQQRKQGGKGVPGVRFLDPLHPPCPSVCPQYIWDTTTVLGL